MRTGSIEVLDRFRKHEIIPGIPFRNRDPPFLPLDDLGWIQVRSSCVSWHHLASLHDHSQLLVHCSIVGFTVRSWVFPSLFLLSGWNCKFTRLRISNSWGVLSFFLRGWFYAWSTGESILTRWSLYSSVSVPMLLDVINGRLGSQRALIKVLVWVWLCSDLLQLMPPSPKKVFSFNCCQSSYSEVYV